MQSDSEPLHVLRSRHLRTDGKPIREAVKPVDRELPAGVLSATRAENFYLHARGKLTREGCRPVSEALHELAQRVGIEPTYFSLAGELVKAPDEALRAVLKAMGIAAGDDDEIAASLAGVAPISLDPLVGA